MVCQHSNEEPSSLIGLPAVARFESTVRILFDQHGKSSPQAINNRKRRTGVNGSCFTRSSTCTREQTRKGRVQEAVLSKSTVIKLNLDQNWKRKIRSTRSLAGVERSSVNSSKHGFCEGLGLAQFLLDQIFPILNFSTKSTRTNSAQTYNLTELSPAPHL